MGYICETDTFGSNRKLTEIQEGDILCLHNAGAYCFSMASNYNSRYRPAEVLLYEGKDYLIREREDFDDLLKNQVEVDVLKEKYLGESQPSTLDSPIKDAEKIDKNISKEGF